MRYYEEMGLLTPAQRTDGGFRLYTEEEVERLGLIKQMKPLGFTVQQMRDLAEEFAKGLRNETRRAAARF